jgi:hypothetical protein
MLFIVAAFFSGILILAFLLTDSWVGGLIFLATALLFPLGFYLRKKRQSAAFAKFRSNK